MKSFRQSIALAVLSLVLSLAAQSQEIVSNGSFDAFGENGAPQGWRFFRSNNESCQIRLADGALRLDNAVAAAPNVYGGSATEIKVEPHRKYTVSLRIKADGESQGLSLAIGVGWRIRLPILGVTSEWQSFSYDFTLEPEDIQHGVATLAILSEDIAAGVAIDDVTVEAAGNLPAAHNAARIVANGKFEQIVRNRPENWFFGRSNAPHSEMRPVKDSDRNAVLVNHPYPAAPNVYCVIGTTVKVQPDTPYRLRFKARGESADGSNIALGKNWSKRFYIKGVTTEWKDYEYDFSLTRDELEADFTTPLALIVEDATVNGLFTDFAITPLLETDTLIAIPEVATLERLPEDIEYLPGFAHETRAAIVRYDGKNYLAAAFSAPGQMLRLFLPELGQSVELTPEKGTAVVLPDELEPIFRFALLEFQSGENAMEPVSGDFRIAITPGVPFAKAFVSQLDPGRSIQGKLYVVPAASDTSLSISAHSDDGSVEPLGMLDANVPSAQFPFYFKLNGYQPMQAVFRGGDRELAMLTVDQADPFDANQNALRQLEAAMKEMEARCAGLREEKRNNTRISAPLLLIRKSIADLNALLPAATPEARQYFNERCDLALEASQSLLERLDAALEAGKLEPTVSRIEAPLTVNGFRPEATALYSDGERRHQVVFFSGYGHQIDAVNLLPQFHELGANAIQIEIGPEYVFPREGKDQEFEADFKFFDDYIERAFRLAAENGVMINLLLAPHYMPKWYFDKYPEISSHTGWLLEYEVNHPRSRALMAAYLDAILPRLAEERYRRVLHGITISNEPIYYGFQIGKPFCQQEFKKYLTERFHGVEQFNRATGNDFASFDAAIQAGTANPAVRYEFNQCKRQLFADWHRFMAEKVRAALPEIAVSAKLMPFRAIDSEFISDGVDIQLYDEFFDYAGQDNGMFYTFGKEKYISDWIHVLLTNEFQYSVGGKSISNTENHPLQDSTKFRIPPENVYTGNMLQYLSGANALITWIWYHAPEYGLAHNISMRPDCVWAQTQSAIDANRFGEEILAFTAEFPEVALLHAETSSVLDDKAYQPLYRLYELSCFSGIRAGVIGERKLRQSLPETLQVLLVADQKYLQTETLPALKAFTDRGGRIVATKGALAFNQYGQPLVLDFPVEFVDRLDGMEQFSRAAGVKLPVQMRSNLEDNRGIFFRTARGADGELLIAVVNFNHGTARLRWDFSEAGELVELRSGAVMPQEYNLKPLELQLLRFSQR